MMTSARPPRPGQAGYALLEVAVALLVLSLGLLGVAKTQALILKSTYSSGQRALVSLAAGSLAAALEGNPSYWRGVSQGRTTPLTLTVTPGSTGPTLSSSDLTAATRECASSSCTATELAAYDLRAWATNLQSQLGDFFQGATLVVQPPDAGTSVNVQITVRWQESLPAIQGNGAGVVDQTLTHYVQP